LKINRENSEKRRKGNGGKRAAGRILSAVSNEGGLELKKKITFTLKERSP